MSFARPSRKRQLLLTGILLLAFGITLVGIDRGRFYLPTKILVETTADSTTWFQLFYDTGRGFNEIESVGKTVPRGGDFRTVVFDLPRIPLRRFRLDPGQQSGHVALRRITLSSGEKSLVWGPREIDAEFGGRHHIGGVSIAGDSLDLAIAGSDPQLVYAGNLAGKLDVTDYRARPRYRRWAVLGFFLAGAAIWFWQVLAGAAVRIWERLSGGWSTAAPNLREQGAPAADTSVQIILVPMAIAIFFYWPFFSSISWSIDDEMSQNRISALVWISQGRWGAGIVEFLFTRLPVVPLLPLLVMGACYGTTVFLMMRCLQARSVAVASLATIAMVTFPSFVAINNFYSNSLPVAIGLACSAFSAYVFTLHIERPAPALKDIGLRYVLILLGESFVLAFAVGCYQSLVLVYLVIGLIAIFTRSLRDLAVPQPFTPWLFLALARLLAGVISGLVLYAVIQKASMSFYHNAVIGAYITSFYSLSELFLHPADAMHAIREKVLASVTGSPSVYGIPFGALPIFIGVVLVLLCVEIISLMLRRKVGFGGVVAGFLLLLATAAPHALEVVSTGRMPLRTNIAFAVFLAGLVICSLGVFSRRSPVRLVILGVTVSLLFFQVDLFSRYLAQAQLTYDADKATARALYYRIAEVYPQFDRDKPVYVDIYGYLDNSNPAYPVVDSIGGSFFHWDNGNASRMLAFLDCLGYKYFRRMPPAMARELFRPHLSAFDSMPIWPSAGSVVLRNEVVLIKLGPSIDSNHSYSLNHLP